jgi:hypothetical protein
MDDPLCQRFFTEPMQTLHRRYEILRAHFVEQRPLQAIAEQFGLNYYTVRALVRAFRVQCQARQVPPFLPSRSAGGPSARAPRHSPPSRTRRLWPMVVNSRS